MSSVRDINDGLTALCVSQQRIDRERLLLRTLHADGLSQMDTRPERNVYYYHYRHSDD